MKDRANFSKKDATVILVCVGLLLINIAAIGRGGRERAKRSVCLSNLKQLTLAWIMFAEDNNDKLVNGDTEEYGDFETQTGAYAPGQPHYQERPWVLRDWYPNLTIADKRRAIEQGALFPYCKDVRLYKCPTIGPKDIRSCTFVDAMNCKGWGDGAVMLKKRSEIPEPAKRFVFVDDGGTAGPTLGGWTCYVKEDKWWDPPPIRHNLGTNFSFADGHSEYWKWKDPRTLAYGHSFPLPPQTGNIDIRMTQVASWGDAAIR